MSDSARVTMTLSVEVVLMKRGGDKYYHMLTKLRSSYNCEIADCYDKPQYLKNILKDVYGNDYEAIIKEIKQELGESIKDKEIVAFLEVLEYKF